MTGDKAIRRLTFAVVLAVAAFAAVVSYSHIFDLGATHGQSGTAARLLPLSVDGLIVAASLVLLHEARHGRAAPVLARLMLWGGIGATVGANVAYGAAYGALGMVISSWPAVSFVGAAEMALGMVRRSRPASEIREAAESGNVGLTQVAHDAEEAARIALAATHAAGNALSGRQLEARFGLSRSQAAKVRDSVLVSANGSAPDGGD